MTTETQQTIPYVPVLDVLDISSTEMIMETCSLRIPVMTSNWREKYPYIPMTAVSLAYTTKALYLHFAFMSKGIRVTILEDGSPVHYDSCVEAFIQIPGDERYINFEFNAAGMCDASRRTGREDPEPFTSAEYAQIERKASLPLKQYVNDFDISCRTLIAKIPLKILGIESEEQIPESIRANFYKCGDHTVIPHFASWALVETEEPDFHRPEYFGTLYLAERKKTRESQPEEEPAS